MKNNYLTHILTWAIFLSLGLWIGHISNNSPTTQHKDNHHSGNHSMHDPMQMSMADMGSMLEGVYGDDLDKAFLEGMIPHHQWAIGMAKFLVNAKHPELKKMGEEIITAQQAEIDQMSAWLEQWGYKN